MSSPNDTHSLIIDYLLGRLSETELERFEHSYLTNEELFNDLQEVEDELIDDYANGGLTAEQSLSFEKYFLRSSQRREKLAFATAMTERAIAWQSGTLVFTETPVLDPTFVRSSHSSRSFWRRPVPAWRHWLAMAAAVVSSRHRHFLAAQPGVATSVKRR